MNDKELSDMLFWGVFVIIIFPLLLLSFIYFYLGSQGIKDWLIPISGYVSLITVAIGSWVAVNNYRLKIETEKRLSDASLVGSDVELLKLFSEIMEIAHSRHEPIVSEKVIEGLFQNKIITASDYKTDTDNGYVIHTGPVKTILDTAILVPAYGTASQDAAIAAIYTLGKKHEVLLDSAIEGLIAIDGFVDEKQFSKKKKMLKRFIDELNEYKKQIQSDR